MDYSKTVIYKMVCKDVSITDCYVGHTMQLKTREKCHKTRCCNVNSEKHNLYVYKFIRENGGWDNWDVIKVVDVVDCRDKYDALKVERIWFEKLNPTLNVLKNKNDYDKLRENPQDSSKTYRETNSGYIKEYMSVYKKQYYIDNKERINTEKNRNIQYKVQAKIHYDANRERLCQYAREYFAKNRESINFKKREYRAKRKLEQTKI